VRGSDARCAAASRPDQAFDPLDFFGRQAEIEDVEIGAHVPASVVRSEESCRVEGEAEDDLLNGPAVAFGDPGEFGMGQRPGVGGQQEKPGRPVRWRRMTPGRGGSSPTA